MAEKKRKEEKDQTLRELQFGGTVDMHIMSVLAWLWLAVVCSFQGLGKTISALLPNEKKQIQLFNYAVVFFLLDVL